MPVIDTINWLEDFQEACISSARKDRFILQFQTMIQPLLPYFPEMAPSEIHHYLLDQGLISPHSHVQLTNWIETITEKNVWTTIKKDYYFLRKSWGGPKANIFIFPIEENNQFLMKELGGKMGIGFKDKVFLFLSPHLTRKELRGLLTHEYHHVCRLSNVKKDTSELTLLDSLLIEGLAEVAVEKRLGKEYVAPWVRLYTRDQARFYWQKLFVGNLEKRGKENHDLFLYGNKSKGFPKWIGYSIGYHLVSSIFEKGEKVINKKLLQMPSNQLLKKSDFFDIMEI